jgi:tetratricopeptide (TPR) repeat protein
MGAELRMTFPSVVNAQSQNSIQKYADTVLKAATRFWCAVVVIGQLIFAFTVASYYGMAAVRGTSQQAWSGHITHGYVPGDGIGNFAVAAHLFSAAIVIIAGMLQLVPQIRNRFPVFHRWNGRLYVVTAFSISLAGLYMTWVRGSVGDFSQHLGSSLMAALIMFCAVMALRYALARDFKTHRRWALRLYLVVSASLFIRAGIFLSLVLNRGPLGFDPSTFSGPFLTFITFAQYLVPLGVLELYFRAKERPGAAGRFAMAAGLFVLTVALGVGIFAVTAAAFVPNIKKAYDNRISVAETLSATIASSGIDEATKKYHILKTAASTTYNFDEDELNSLGYQLINARKFKEATRILQLNVEAYPQSANTYDSLGEAYMDDGNKTLAIANYKKSLELNPKNGNAVKMLQKLKAP